MIGNIFLYSIVYMKKSKINFHVKLYSFRGNYPFWTKLTLVENMIDILVFKRI